jgi:hypothetical protein
MNLFGILALLLTLVCSVLTFRQYASASELEAKTELHVATKKPETPSKSISVTIANPYSDNLFEDRAKVVCRIPEYFPKGDLVDFAVALIKPPTTLVEKPILTLQAGATIEYTLKSELQIAGAPYACKAYREDPVARSQRAFAESERKAREARLMPPTREAVLSR